MSDELRQRLQRALGGAYPVQQELGGGGMSRVFVVRDTALDRLVVVKVLPERASDIDAERFRREVALAARLQHPNIVGVLSAGQSEGLLYYVMPHVDGESLRARLATGPLAVGEAVRVMCDVARALAYAHEHGIAHRDIKPENVLLSGRAAAVTDFGIAKALSTSRGSTATVGAPAPAAITAVGLVIGTLAYMAPEQAAGDPVDHRADFYSLGIVAYEMLCGAPPFRAESARALLAAHLRDPPAPLAECRPDAPPALADLVMRCLEKDPARRPQAASEILDALDAIGPTSGGRVRRRLRWLGRRTAAGVSAVAVAAVGALVAAPFAAPWRGTEAPNSLVVLPFENLGGDPGDDYLGDGMSEELIAALSEVRGLRVVARTSSFAFKDRDEDVREIASALDVGAVLDGSVRRSGDRLRVTAQLTRAQEGITLWSETYDRRMGDVLTLQQDIAQAIVEALELRLVGGGRALLRRRPTTDATAWELYLRGRFEWNRRRRDALDRALVYYDSAVAKDTTFALAYSGLADAYVVLGNWGHLPAPEAAARSLAAARRAVALDSTLAEARASHASVLCVYVWDWPAAEAEFTRAIALNPGLATTRYFYSRCLAGHGRFRDAVAQARTAITFDPLNPQIATALASAFLAAEQYDSAIVAARRALRTDPAHVGGRYWLAAGYAAKGEYDQARAVVREISGPDAEGPIFTGLTGAVAALAGDTATAHGAVRALQRRPDDQPFHVAQIYAALGRRDSAVVWLERAYAQRSEGLVVLTRVIPWMAPLRSDPRALAVFRAAGVR